VTDPRPRTSLGTRLALLNALLIGVAVCLGFALLSLSIRGQTREFLARTLAHHQRTIVTLQEREIESLLRTSALMSDSPTLRAAMETYQDEVLRSDEARPDLLETIRVEAQRVAAGIGHDLFVVSDRAGKVLAWIGGPRSGIVVGEALAESPIVHRALAQDAPVSAHSFAVVRLSGEYFRVGSVPIVLQGFVIGALTVGDRIDDAFARRLQETFDCDFLVTDESGIVGSTLAGAIAPAHLTALRAGDVDAGESRVVRLPGGQYVAAVVPLGRDERGRELRLHLLNSLSAALGAWSRSVAVLMLVWGVIAVTAAGAAAWGLSRSVLRPLAQFVDFMRGVARSGEHDRRFAPARACAEIAALNATYDQLMDSLVRHERELLRRAKDDLERLERLQESEKLAALGRMLSGAAHEINNPLTGVFGNIEMLLRQDGLDAAARARLERARQDCRRVVALVRNLLKTSRRDVGTWTPVDVPRVLREAVEVRRHDFAQAGLSLELRAGTEPLEVLGSELELHQVFLNIVNNAFDALQEHGGSRLTIACAIDGRRAVVTFEDDGPGMKDPRQVFEHFYTTKGIGKGTGLGLSICQATAERHGGEIAAENIAGGGARFRVTLPLCATQAARGPAAPEAVPCAEPLAGPLVASVLVVDDEPTIVDLQREILEDLGAAVVGVASGEEAIRALEGRSFDVVVTDLRMPGAVSGRDVVRWLELHRPEALPRVVLVTGDTTGDESRLLVEQTGARLLAKPFSVQDYVRTLREIHEARHVAC